MKKLLLLLFIGFVFLFSCENVLYLEELDDPTVIGCKTCTTTIIYWAEPDNVLLSKDQRVCGEDLKNINLNERIITINDELYISKTVCK